MRLTFCTEDLYDAISAEFGFLTFVLICITQFLQTQKKKKKKKKDSFLNFLMICMMQFLQTFGV